MFIRSRSQLLCKKSGFEKFCKLYQRIFGWSPLLRSWKPTTCNCIKIETLAQELFSDFCEILQNSLLQKNRERLLQHVGIMEKYSRNRQFIIKVT